jgi:hypothetical protein
VTRWFEARQAHELCISAMSWAELHRGVTRLPESRRRHELAAWLQDLEAGFEDRILSFDRKAAEVWAQILPARLSAWLPSPARGGAESWLAVCGMDVSLKTGFVVFIRKR